MPTPILQQMLGQGGTMEFIDGTVTGKNYDFLVVNTAATFTTLTGTGSENLLTAYALSGKSVSAGNQIHLQQIGAGQVTFAQGAGVTITSTGATASAPKLRKQYSACTIICTASNTFTILGDLA